MTPESAAARARQAASWMFLEEAFVWGTSFGARILLARLLFPRDFGLIAMVTLVQGLVLLLGTRGVSASLIQRTEHVDEYANACFWLTPLVGAAIGSLQIALAPLAARFYHEPLLTPLLMVSAIGFFVSPWGATHAALLDKTLRVKQRALRHMTLSTVSMAGMVVMAYRGYGVWSFVIPPLLVDPLQVVMNWRLSGWRPRFTLNLGYWREIVRYGKHVLGGDLLRYAIENTDYLVLGRLLGAGPLGFYSFAFRQSKVVMRHVTFAAGRITFPTFSLLQGERETLRKTFARSLLLISSLTLPLQLGQFALAREYFIVLYSAKWLPAVTPFRILLLYGTAVAISTVPRQLLAAVGRPDLVWKFHAMVWPVLAGAILLAVRQGIVGVALAVGIVLGASSWIFMLYAMRLLGWPARTALAPVWPPLASAALMSAAVGLIRWALLAMGASPATVLVVSIPAGGVVYAGAMMLLFPRTWRELRGFLRRSLGASRAGPEDPAGGSRRRRPVETAS